MISIAFRAKNKNKKEFVDSETQWIASMGNITAKIDDGTTKWNEINSLKGQCSCLLEGGLNQLK